jgi:hypothetical protein
MKNIQSIIFLFFIATACKKEVTITKYALAKTDNLTTKEINQNIDLKGNYFIKTKVSSVETGEPIEITFYFSFETSQAILSIGTNNSLEAYCEGTYTITQNKGVSKLIYNGEGTCTSDLEESSFLIKKEKNQYYIKSKRFIDFEWYLLNRKY